MHVGKQRFSVRGLRLDRRDKGVILKSKEAGRRLRFEVDRNRSRLTVKVEPGPSMLRVRLQEEF